MIALVLQDVVSADDERELHAALADQEGIEVIPWGSPDVFQQTTLDALMLDAWAAGELFAVPPPFEPVEVVVDEQSGKRAFLHSATVASADNPQRTMNVPAPWVVRYAALRYVDAAPSLSDEEFVYATVLNALEVMERHNAAATPGMRAIRRAGIRVGSGWAAGLLRAYRTYRHQAFEHESP
jgi:hypothetical protein